jgi:hypothetical protein
MPYTTANGRHADTLPVTLHESAARTATGSGSALELGDRGTLRLILTVSAASGTTPTLDVTVETSFDGSTWRSAGTFAQRTSAASERKSFPGCDRFVRISYTIGGTTPSFTFSVSGEAV